MTTTTDPTRALDLINDAERMVASLSNVDADMVEQLLAKLGSAYLLVDELAYERHQLEDAGLLDQLADRHAHPFRSVALDVWDALPVVLLAWALGAAFLVVAMHDGYRPTAASLAWTSAGLIVAVPLLRLAGMAAAKVRPETAPQ